MPTFLWIYFITFYPFSTSSLKLSFFVLLETKIAQQIITCFGDGSPVLELCHFESLSLLLFQPLSMTVNLPLASAGFTSGHTVPQLRESTDSLLSHSTPEVYLTQAFLLNFNSTPCLIIFGDNYDVKGL